MAKKKAECYCCGKKGYRENYIEEQLDDEEHSIYFCSECCRDITSEETILNTAYTYEQNTNFKENKPSFKGGKN